MDMIPLWPFHAQGHPKPTPDSRPSALDSRPLTLDSRPSTLDSRQNKTNLTNYNKL